MIDTSLDHMRTELAISGRSPKRSSCEANCISPVQKAEWKADHLARQRALQP
jgi:hypothetical protein